MALEKKGSPIVVPAIRVADLPALPDDITDSTGMRKWWNDFRQVLARLIQSKSTTQTQIQQVQTTVTETEKQVAAESKPVEWDEIRNKPAKFPPADHEHETPWFQVEGPLVLSDVDPATNLATLGFYEQKAGYFLGGPVDGPEAKPVFRPLYAGDDRNFDGSGATDTPTPGTYDDLNGGTGGGSPVGGIVTQARGGSWSLGGFSACDGTAPNRRWLTRTGSGTIRWDGDTGWQYGSLACAHLYTLSGVQHYDASTLVCAGQIQRTYAGAGPGIGVGGYCLSSPVSPATWQCGCGELWSCGMLGDTQTATATTGTRVPTASGWSGSHVATLSDEDTSDNAVARLMATDPAWAISGTAIRTIPTTGTTGVYRQARYRTEHTETEGQQLWVEGQWVNGAWVAGHYRTASTSTTYPTLTGLSPWGLYRLTVTLESRPVDSAGAPTGSGEWSAAGTRTHNILANIDGEAGIDWQTVEPTAGYETRIGTPTVEAA